MLKGHQAHWSTLIVIGIVAGIGLVLEANLKVSTTTHHVLLLVWCAITYVTLAGWVSNNQSRLLRQPVDPDDDLDNRSEREVA
ncbi:MAG: hypothetical protein IT320_02540 [Anaerolineae bacterium]|nr:hypothetical protein [Anaerolineae bacterium]